MFNSLLKLAALLFAKLAYGIAVTSANTVCLIVLYQTPLPDKVKQLRKF